VSGWRIFLAGVASGAATNVAMVVSFRLLGFRSGLLLDPRWQSPKLIAVWSSGRSWLLPRPR